jgi:hypothetical protein
LEFGRDYSTVYVASRPAGWLDAGIVDAAILSVLENILARQKGFNELAFSGTILNFRRIRFGSSTKKIKENPDEI